MAPTKVLNCSHGQGLFFEYNRRVQLAEGRALREFTTSGSLKKARSLSHHNTVITRLRSQICTGRYAIDFKTDRKILPPQ